MKISLILVLLYENIRLLVEKVSKIVKRTRNSNYSLTIIGVL